MKKRYLFILLLTPTLILELVLHVNTNLFKAILLNNSSIKYWKSAAPKINYWPETIIMGSSVARQGIDPKVLEHSLRDNGISTKIGNISHNASSLSHEYLTLKRILATCKKCPTRIVFQATDIAFKKNEIWLWKESTLNGIQSLYFPDKEIDDVLKKSASLDPYYKQYLQTLSIETSLRIPFTKGRIINMLFDGNTYQPDFLDPEKNLAYTTHLTNETRKISLSYGENELAGYDTGGATKYLFEEFIQLAKKNNIKVYIVVMPQHNDYVERFKIYEEKFVNLIIYESKKFELPLINDRTFNNKNDLIFYDLNHLNIDGAPIYSMHLGSQLSKLWSI